MEERIFNEDAEVAVLSIVVNNPELIPDVLEVKPYMFSNKINSGIFDRIMTLFEKGVIPDLKLLETEFTSSNELDSMGGKSYLDYLRVQKFLPKNLNYYVTAIVNDYKTKQLMVSLNRTQNSISSSSEIDFIVSNLRTELDQLTTSYGGNGTVVIGDIIDSAKADIEDRMKNPGIKGFTTGFTTLDGQTTGINPKELWIIAGRPGMGKTALDCNMILNAAKNGIKSLFIELEMGQHELVHRFLAIDTGIPLTPHIRMGQMNKDEFRQITNSLKSFKDLPIYLNTKITTDLNYIESTIRKHKRLHDINLVFIDYIQLLSVRGEDSVHELGRISRMAKLLARDLDIGIIINSQLNRGVESREDKRPLASDLRQSGNLEEDADLVIMLYRDELYNPINVSKKNELEVLIRKNRNGPIGVTTLGFNPQNNRMWDN